VPSVFRSLSLAHEQAGAPPLELRYVVFGGESVDLDVIGRFAARVPAPRLINMYGITEITVHATFKQLTPDDLAGPVRSPVGSALPHLAIELRDETGAPVAPGQPGEMWISGAGVAAGYLHRSELTAERFVTADGRRYYRSGDLARRLPSGEFEYLGRTDQQVKLRGFRIEPGEIEAILRDHRGVRDAAVTVVSTAGGAQFLTACVVPAADELPDLRTYAAGALPGHMVPHRYLAVSALPRTPSGKLDRAALTDLATARPSRGNP
jgi:nonribosomal peptide synthetase DhbF